MSGRSVVIMGNEPITFRELPGSLKELNPASAVTLSAGVCWRNKGAGYIKPKNVSGPFYCSSFSVSRSGRIGHVALYGNQRFPD